MNKPIATAIYSLLVMVVFFGTSAVIQSCGNNKNTEEATDVTGDYTQDSTNSYTQDEFFEEEGGETSSNTDYDNDDDNYSTGGTPSSTRSYSNPNTQTSSYNSSTEPYMIVAGNYLLEDNADQMIKELSRKGYTNAEKVVFDLSQYHTVIAGRYDTRTAASAASSELKRAGIDNYVIKKK